ncbi:two component transcriptional regulator, LuxR family [Faunimonas pinastri]|uniref:Two component transcriptional regulator, LuxR family n=1 Tax=Faunimonas pinastri TaxID=1855383 RepID=A0A1H9ID71_9HYPH|nr:response regulator transcription factor [Faunimonas pinastri]SEQ72530.1 two component transcriptional regulator, LuxR family [Faunimonas pinastri]
MSIARQIFAPSQTPGQDSGLVCDRHYDRSREPGPVTIAIADERPLLLQGLRTAFPAPRFHVVAACTETEPLLRTIRRERPDLVVVDIALPGISGLGVLKAIRAEDLPTRVVMLTDRFDIPDIASAIREGAFGVVLKRATAQDLLACIEAVAAGSSWIQPEVAKFAMESILGSRLRGELKPVTLTARERDIVGLVSSGRRNKEIAYDLQITEGTVKMHLHTVFRKLGVTSRTELALKNKSQGSWAEYRRASVEDWRNA